MKLFYYLMLAFGLVAAGIVLLYMTSYRTQAYNDNGSFSVKKINMQTIGLKPLGSFKGNGIATRNFDGKKFTSVVKINAPSPDDGKYYQAWLVKTKPGLASLSIGKFTQRGDEFVLTYEVWQNYNDYNKIIITEESADFIEPTTPGDRVLMGSF